jgi:hypothetical protein
VVLPILMEDAVMPAAVELPEDTRDLAELHAIHLRDGEWQRDVDAICAVLRRHVRILGPKSPFRGTLRNGIRSFSTPSSQPAFEVLKP